MRNFIFVVVCVLSVVPVWGRISVHDDALHVDGVRQPQLWGAELQYFRLRGGYGRNVPRAKVMELWNRALDRMVELKMNTVSFYIPWDFHEYAPGKFDFTGTADEDGDGHPDYPSRDIKTFFKMVEAHGIKRIMVRPGPYINAEWGFLGFGAIPLWFHEKYPNSHMKNSQGLRTKLYDYHNPDLLRLTENWFTVLYNEVLKEHMGPGKPIMFLQIDNETNFMWQSLYNHDYGDGAMMRYRNFLMNRYGSLEAINQHHHRSWQNLMDIKAPTEPGKNFREDQDWYRFQDESIYEYLVQIRFMWERLGVNEPQILFTLAESYDHTNNGQLVNFKYRNMPGKTGMGTMNNYPKTYETPASPFINRPFKLDHDVKAMDAASDYYLGSRQEWVLGPEIQGGWWRGITVSPETRRQIYLSALGQGLKALFIYYFTEGDNWQVEWARNQVLPLYKKLRTELGMDRVLDQDLPESFWQELQARVEREVLVGINAKHVMHEDLNVAEKLFFDAPLDGDAQPRNHFHDLKVLSDQIINPYQDFLAASLNLNEGITLLKDVENHAPSSAPGVSNLMLNANWSAGLVGYLMQIGYNPEIKHFGMNPWTEIASSKVIFYQDPGDPAVLSRNLVTSVKGYLDQGGTFVSWVGTSVAEHLGVVKNVKPYAGPRGSVTARVLTISGVGNVHIPSEPLFTFEHECHEIMSVGGKAVAVKCKVGKGTFIQISGLIHDQYNSDVYSDLTEGAMKNAFLKGVLDGTNVSPYWILPDAQDRVVVSSRASSEFNGVMLTVKSAHKTHSEVKIRASSDLLKQINALKAQEFWIKDLYSGDEIKLTNQQLLQDGFFVRLKPLGSTVYFITTH